MQQRNRLDALAILYCVVAMLCWTAGPLFITYLVGYLDGWTQNALRYSIATLCWLPLLVYALAKGAVPRALWKRALIPSAPNVFMQTFWTFCFYVATPALAVLITKTSVLWIAGISLVVFPAERALAQSRRFWLGLVLSLTGLTGVIVSGPDFIDPANVKGIVIPLINALFGAAYVVAVRAALHGVDARLGFCVVSIYTTTLLWVAALCFGEVSQCLAMSARPWLWLILSSVTGIALGHVSFYAAIRRMGATLPALILLVQPFAVLIGSHFLFEETMNSRQVLCGVVLLLGAAFAILAQKDLAENGRG